MILWWSIYSNVCVYLWWVVRKMISVEVVLSHERLPMSSAPCMFASMGSRHFFKCFHIHTYTKDDHLVYKLSMDTIDQTVGSIFLAVMCRRLWFIDFLLLRRMLLINMWVVLSTLQDGISPLSIASEKGHHGIVKLMCEYNADVNSQDKVGKNHRWRWEHNCSRVVDSWNTK